MAREQCIELIREEYTKKWELLPSDFKLFLSGASKNNITGKTPDATKRPNVSKSNMNVSSKIQHSDSTMKNKNISPAFYQSLSQAESQQSSQNTPIKKKLYLQAKK